MWMGLPWAPSLWGQWGFHGRFRGADAAQWPLHKPYRQQRTHSPCGAVDPNRSLCQSLMHPGVTAGQTRCTVPHAGLGSGAHASTRCPQPPTWGEMGRESCCDPHPHHPCPHGSPSMCILYSPCSSSCRSVPMDPPSPWVSYPPPWVLIPAGPHPCASLSLHGVTSPSFPIPISPHLRESPIPHGSLGVTVPTAPSPLCSSVPIPTSPFPISPSHPAWHPWGQEVRSKSPPQGRALRKQHPQIPPSSGPPRTPPAAPCSSSHQPQRFVFAADLDLMSHD